MSDEDNEYNLIVDVPCAPDEIDAVDACLERVAARMELEEVGSGYGGGWRDYQYVIPPTMTFTARSRLLQQAYVLLRSEGLWTARALIQTITAAERAAIERHWRAQCADPEKMQRLREKFAADWDAYQARRDADNEEN